MFVDKHFFKFAFTETKSPKPSSSRRMPNTPNMRSMKLEAGVNKHEGSHKNLSSAPLNTFERHWNARLSQRKSVPDLNNAIVAKKI